MSRKNVKKKTFHYCKIPKLKCLTPLSILQMQIIRESFAKIHKWENEKVQRQNTLKKVLYFKCYNNTVKSNIKYHNITYFGTVQLCALKK